MVMKFTITKGQIRESSITGGKLRESSITGGKLRESSINGIDDYFFIIHSDQHKKFTVEIKKLELLKILLIKFINL
jgi:hypothetical protein